MKKAAMFLSLALFLFVSLELSFAQMSSTEIEAIQKTITEKGLSWMAGETDITRMTDEEKNAMLGAVPMDPALSGSPRPEIAEKGEAGLPTYFSWGSHAGYNWMTPVRNQGNCGSCWAFAACGVLEPKNRFFENQPTRAIDISEQDIVSCGKGDCNDWNMPATFSHLESNGSPDDPCFPYVSGSGAVPPCGNHCSDWLSRAFFVGYHNWQDSPSITTIKNEIQTFGPVTAYMKVYTDFDAYTSGVYVHTTGTYRGGHFIVIYGWDDANNCWLCKNSWGTGWGETGPDGTGGWFRAQMGGANCEHAKQVYWADPEELPNLVHTTPSGWTYPVVPRNNNTATPTSCAISSTLPGNSNSTYLNWGFTNNGLFIARDIYSEVFVDASAVWWHWLEFLNPGVVENRFVNQGPLTIRGGRHTICDSLDYDNTVFEKYENDNAYLRQFVWSPYVLAENTPVNRSAPPWQGNLTYPNSDGFKFTKPASYASGVGIIPHNSADDYDLRVYSNYTGSQSGFSSQLAWSGYVDGYADFVVGTYTSSPNVTYPAITRWGTDHNSGVHIDATSSIGRIASTFPKTWSGESLPAYRVLNVYEVYLYEGDCYSFNLDNTSGSANLGLAVYPARPGFYTRSGYRVMANVNGPGGDEGFNWSSDTTGWFPLVVFKHNYGDYSDANVYTLKVTPASITVTSPDGGENWCGNTSHNITWDSDCVSGTVKLEYSTNGGSSWNTITSATANDGVYAWTVPNVSSSACRVKAISNDDPSIWDQSDANFTITPEAIAVSSPNGGENWAVGSTHNITWSSSCVSGTVKIDYSTNGGTSWVTLASSTTNDGSFPWTIPDIPSVACRVRIAPASDGDPADASDGNFIIYTPCASASRCILFDQTHGYISEMGDDYTVAGYFSELGDLLIAQDYSVQTLTTSFTYSNIQEFDVLALIVPQRSFTAGEYVDIEQFLNDGKEIVLLGEWGYHYGDTARTVINGLMSQLGINIRLNDDGVYDDTDNDGINYWPEIPNFANHTVSQGIGMIVPFFSASVIVSEPAQVLAWGDADSYTLPHTKAAEPGAISAGSGPIGDRGMAGSKGDVPVAAVYEDGCRRVYVGGDANIWDRFDWDGDGTSSLYERDNELLALNVFGWEECIELISPDGGENWEVGSSQDITWYSLGLGNVKIEYSTDGGASWSTVTASTPNDGIHPWTVPNSPSVTCRVRVSDAADGIPLDASDHNFIIYKTCASASRCVLFDETHGPYYSYVVTQDYSLLGNLLIAQGYSVQTLTSEFTYGNIQEFDVLTLVMPQERFGGTEKAAIEQFLNDGKEIVVLGDHGGFSPGDTAAAVINDLMDYLGIFLRLYDDWVEDSTNNDGQDYWPEIPNFAVHDLTQGVSMIVPYAGASVKYGAGTTLLAWGDDDSYTVDASKALTSGANSFSPGQGDSKAYTSSKGDVPVAAVYENGCARAYLGGDINIWTNNDPDGDGMESLFERDNEVLALNVFGWECVSQSITVTSPNGGEDWCAGSAHNITWNSSQVSDVKIEYSTNGGSSWTTVIASTPSDGNHPWTVPNAPSPNCLVRICDAADGSPCDISDAAFTIGSQQITTTSPDGGENLEVGSIHNITWTSSCMGGNVKLEWSTDGGTSWSAIAASTANDGDYPWAVPSTPSVSCKVKISDASDGIPYDESDHNFIIYIPCAGAPRCILFDETHGYVSEGEGYKLAGWYSELGNLLVAQGYSVRSLSTTFTYSNIQEADVLALVAPQRRFDASERSAVEQFLNDGKEVVLLGDHGNFAAGDSAREVINELMGYLGINIRVNDDAVFDDTDNDGFNYWPEIPNFAVHDLSQGLGMILPLYGASVSTTAPAQALAWGDADSYVLPGAKADESGLTSSGAGPLADPGPNGSKGEVPVLAINQDGCSRVYVGGDINIWDSKDWDADGTESIYERDNAQLALNVFGWECADTCAYPEHFLFTDSTGDSYSIVIDSALLDDSQLLRCDEIAVYTDSGGGMLCVGASVYDPGNLPIPLIAWKDDPLTSQADGYTAGDTMYFREWSKGQSREECASVRDPSGNGRFEDGVFFQAWLSAPCPQPCEEIPVAPGWQWISTNIDPSPCKMESIFVDCWGDLDIVIAGDGSFCIPGVGCWIDCWNISEMYNCHMTSAGIIRVCGPQVPADTPIPLPGGWNGIAYFPDCPLEPGYALSSIWSDLDIVKNDAGEFCIPGVGCWIECLEPNRGYKIHLSDPATLIYPTDCPPCPPPFAKMPEVREFARSTHFLYRERTAESYSMVVNSVDINGMAPEVGDEIGVFTPSGLCVGAGAWQDDILGIAVWRDDELTDAVDGFRSGERMAFRFWDKSENRELELSASYAKGSGIFAAGPFALLDLSLDAKASQQAAVELEVEQNYPNPFNPATTISFSLPATSNVSLKIYNLLGREVRTLVDQAMTAGGHSISWDGKDNSGKLVASGIYFYRLSAGEFTTARKMIFMR